MSFPSRYQGVLKVSPMNSVIYSGSTQVAPRRTSISEASRSLGCTRSSACTLTSYSWSLDAKERAVSSFARTFPERYSSAFSYLPVSGFLKMTPVSSCATSSSVFPVSCAIYSRSTRAFSPMERARASLAVSTLVTGSARRIVRLVKISAFRSNLPSSSRISRDARRQ